jgi:hypothetical protein
MNSRGKLFHDYIVSFNNKFNFKQKHSTQECLRRFINAGKYQKYSCKQFDAKIAKLWL